MVKYESISNDLNLVKEFEELKLKQKLLIEALNSKNKIEMNQFLLDVNAKLDFLVKIFKDSQKAEEEDTTENEIKENLNSILERFENLDKKIDEKFELMENKFEDLNKKLLKTEGIVERNLEHPSSSIPNPSFRIDPNLKVPSDDKKINENKIENLVNNTKKEEEKKKKKKWF